MVYYGNLIEIFIPALIVLIVSIIFSIFSPLGIFFIIFSIIRGKTKNPVLRRVSLVSQIILAALTFIIGILVALLFLTNRGLYLEGLIFILAIILGVGFVVAVEVGVIIWETYWLKKKIAEVSKIKNFR